MIMTSGFYIPIEHLPVWLRWISWVSYFRYTYDALIYNEYMGRMVRLSPNAQFFSSTTLESFGNVTAVQAKYIFDALDLHTNLWINILALLGFFGLFHVAAYLAILYFVM